jgi:hypothetical protein
MAQRTQPPTHPQRANTQSSILGKQTVFVVTKNNGLVTYPGLARNRQS